MSRHLMITADYPPRPGGQSRYIHDLWGWLPSDQAVILAPKIPGADAARDPENVIHVPVPLGGSWWDRVRRVLGMIRAAFSRCRQERPQAIHAGQILASGSAGLVCNLLLGIPYTVIVHGADLLEFADSFPAGILVRAVLHRASRVIVNSRYTANIVLARGGSLGKIQVVHPMVDPALFEDVAGGARIRARFGLEGRKVILTVGRLVERKGQDTVLRALPTLLRDEPDCHYLIVGDGPYREPLTDLARRLGVERKVTFAGFVPDRDLPDWYAASDLFVMISREIPERGDVEGFGIVYLEAAAAGRAVIAGDSGGVSDAVEDGAGGILVPPDDPAALAETLRRVLGNRGLRREMGMAGRTRVLNRFTTERGRNEILEVLDEIARAG